MIHWISSLVADGTWPTGHAIWVHAAAQVLAASPELVPAIITHRYPLEAAPEAFATAADRSAGAIKVVLEP